MCPSRNDRTVASDEVTTNTPHRSAMSAPVPLAARLLTRGEKAHSATDSAGGAGLILSASLAVATACWWWNFDLLSPLTLPGPDRLVQAFSLTLATLAASVATLGLMAAWRMVRNPGRGSDVTGA